MDILTFERRHANGAIAYVYRDSEGAGYLPSAFPPPEPADEAAWPYLDTIDEAQAAADALAHADCSGEGCAAWTLHHKKPME